MKEIKEVDGIDEARKYVSEFIGSQTTEYDSYIKNHLAGDFACLLSNMIQDFNSTLEAATKREQKLIEALREMSDMIYEGAPESEWDGTKAKAKAALQEIGEGQ